MVPDLGRDDRVLLAVVVGTFSSGAGRFAIPAALPTAIALYDLSSTQAGYVLTALVVGFGLSQYPGGRYADVHRPTLVLALGVLTFVLGFALLATTTTYLLLLVGALVVGIANGLYVPSSLSTLIARFPDRAGRVFGINGAAVQLGSAAGPVIAAGAIALGHWQLAFPPLILTLCAAGLLLRGTVRGAGSGDRWMDLAITPALRRVVTHRRARITLVAFVGVGFVFQGGINFLPVYLEGTRGFSTLAASIIFGSIFLVATIGNPAAGTLGDRVGLITVAAGVIGASLLGLVAFTLFETRVAVVGGILLFGVGLASFWPLMDAYVMEALPNETRAGDFGILNTLSLVGGTTGPVVVGAIADRYGLPRAYRGLVVIVGAVLLLLAWTAYRERSAGD